VEVDLIIEGDEIANPTVPPKPSDEVPADWKQDKSHVELESLSCTLSCA